MLHFAEIPLSFRLYDVATPRSFSASVLFFYCLCCRSKVAIGFAGTDGARLVRIAELQALKSQDS